MRFRKLRIAWSVVCAVACVLLIALWVRSYWRIDELIRVSPTLVSECCTYDGQIIFSRSNDVPAVLAYKSNIGEGWYLNSMPVETWHNVSPPLPGQRIIRGFSSKPNEFIIPFWAASLFLATLSGIAWIGTQSCRFALRTLLIATTLVAEVLGLIVWSVR